MAEASIKAKGKLSSKVIFIIVIGLLLLLCCGCSAIFALIPTPETSNTDNKNEKETTPTITSENITAIPTTEVRVTEILVPTPTVAPTKSLTISQENALKSAKAYLDYSAFSYSGLVEQLKYEKYSPDDAVFAVDNCGADWNDQAAKSAKSYIDYTAFSRGGLIDQLKYEGFTQEQAEYGAKAVGL